MGVGTSIAAWIKAASSGVTETVDALAGGTALTQVNPAILAGMADVMRVATAGQGAQLAWPALLRKADKLDPSFRT